MSKKKLNIAVIGATGYTGLDLISLLCKHPKVKINYLCSTQSIGKKISDFDKRIKKQLPNLSSVKKINWSKIDLAFLSLPNGEAQKLIKKNYFKYQNLKFIDLSADFRINNYSIYKKIYNFSHKAKNLIKKSIYSVSEFVNEDVRKYRIISNPGCYPTSIQLPLLPLLLKRMIKSKNIVIDSKSGFSGAGKNFDKKFKHKNKYHSLFAYSTKYHRHIAEIDQELFKRTKQKINYTFNPHVIPTFRGILSSIYLELNSKNSAKKVRGELLRFYKNNRFIKILKLNTEIGSGDAINTNECKISICETRYKNKIVIFSALDNLVKGASGQAVQNMNLLYKYPENLGLK